MATKRTLPPIVTLVAIAALVLAPAAVAEHHPSSQLLLPCFEVTLDRSVDTLFAVGNVTERTVPIEVVLTTNWGVEVLRTDYELGPKEVLSVNLWDWLVRGVLPGELIPEFELAHLQAALCGDRSPADGLYYGTMPDPMDPTLLVGNVQVRVRDGADPEAVFGDFFIVREDENFAMGDILVNHAPQTECCDLCSDHAVRFLDGGAFDGSSMLMVWSDVHAEPSDSPYLPEEKKIDLYVQVYNERGDTIDYRHLRVMPVDMISVAALGLPEEFGWFEIHSTEPTALSITHSARGRFNVGYLAHCIERRDGGGTVPGLDLEKHTNGFDADSGMGPRIPVGDPVEWSYRVTNTGPVALTDVTVVDSEGLTVDCPQNELEPAETMVCTASGVAEACQYSNLGTATGLTPTGGTVSDQDPSHYFGDYGAEIEVEKSTNGEDADQAPGPTLAVGSLVSWEYVVTNTGETRLTNVGVVDDTGIVVSCPAMVLEPGESMTCTASGIAVAGQYRNVGEARGYDACAQRVVDQDASHYRGEAPAVPAVELEKATNGQDADTPPGPTIEVGDPVTWTYVVTNVGERPLEQLVVTDDRGVAVTCPKTALVVGESMTCTASGVAVAGLYRNVGLVQGEDDLGEPVRASDPSHYTGEVPASPAVRLEKATNGIDADTPPGPTIGLGHGVVWTYVVTNTGNVILTDVTVVDSEGETVTCPKSELAPGEAMTCEARGVAEPCQYSNLGTVTALAGSGGPVTDSDPSHYQGQPSPGIDIEKYTNGEDADVDRSVAGLTPRCKPNDPVEWKYVVTNVGDVPLVNVSVVDDKIGPVDCPADALAVGETMVCFEHGTAVAGQYWNVGTATGTDVCGTVVSDSDTSSYYGQSLGDEGCTPGYWKNHPASWPATGYSPSQTVKSVFAQASAFPALGDATLMAALAFDGGTGVEGAAEILLRAGVAALLDAAHPEVDFPYSEGEVIALVDGALASADRDVMLSTAAALDRACNLGCPLS